MLAAPATAIAHPLGNFTVNRYAGIELTPDEVRIDYVLDLAEIPTVQVRPEIDADADGTVTDAERAAWAARTAPALLANLTLTVDGRPVPLDVVSSSMRFRPGQGGLDILRLEATFAGPVASTGELAFADANFADRIGWAEVTAAGADGTAVAGSSVPARSVSNALLSYPQDLLSSPLDVHEATLSFHPGTGAPVAASTDGAAANGSRPDVTGGAFAGLVGRTGPFMLVALLLAFGFGALHALGPGHGKTLMAAYLVGAGGRARHAVAVGGSVAVMHTASVLALGFVVLTVTEVFAPERVYPWLGLASGLIAFALGASLLVARLGSWSGGRADPEHHHPHEDGSNRPRTRPPAPGPEPAALAQEPDGARRGRRDAPLADGAGRAARGRRPGPDRLRARADRGVQRRARDRARRGRSGRTAGPRRGRRQDVRQDGATGAGPVGRVDRVAGPRADVPGVRPDLTVRCAGRATGDRSFG